MAVDRIKRLLFSLLIAFMMNAITASAAFAAEYYVATDGNDGAAGTQAAPWRTVSHAAKQMNPGDTTYVKGGTYNEPDIVWLKKSGTASAPIRLLNAPSESPKINFTNTGRGGVLIAAGSGMGSTLPIGWITVEGFEITSGAVGFWTNNAHDIVIRRNWIHDNHSQGILGNGKNVLVDRNVINRNGDFAGCAAGKLHAPGRGGIGTVCNKDHGMYVTGTNWTITNNLIYENLAIGIQVAGYPWCDDGTCYGGGARHKTDPSYAGATGWLIANNTIAYNGNGPGITLWQADTRNIKITNNILYENGAKFSSGSSAQGISFYGDSGGHDVSNNLFYATGAGGLAPMGGKVGWQSRYTGSGNLENTANPNFVSAGPTLSGVPDFHLQSSSPAIDKGLSLSEVTWDHAGGKRPFGPSFDIGAYEHGSPPDSGSPPPNPTGGAPLAVARPPSTYNPGASLCP